MFNTSSPNRTSVWKRIWTWSAAYPALTSAAMFLLVGILIIRPALEREWAEERRRPGVDAGADVGFMISLGEGGHGEATTVPRSAAASDPATAPQLTVTSQHGDAPLFIAPRLVPPLMVSLIAVLLLTLLSTVRSRTLERARRKQQALLIKTRDHMQSVLSSTRQVAIIVIDTAGLITQFNKGAELLLGYSAKEVRNLRTISFLFADATPHPALGNPLRAGHDGNEDDLLTESLLHTDQAEFTSRWRRKDGTTVTVNLAVSQLRDGEATTGASLAALDISEHLRAEEALRESERRMHMHALRTPLGVIDWTLDFKVKRWNPSAERIFGIKGSEAIGKHARDLIMTADNMDHIYNVWGRLLHLRERVQVRGRHKRRSGHAVYCDWFNTPLVNEDDEVVGVTSMVYDVTEHIITLREKESLERRLLQGQKMEAIGTLAGGIAHDFNNILFSATGFTEIALAQVPHDSKAATCLQQTLQAHSRAADLIDRILAFSRQSDETPHPLSLAGVIKDELQLLRASLPSTIAIRTDLDLQDDLINAAEVQVHQILMNLCTNAAHAMGGEGGVLEIGLSSIPAGDLEEQAAPTISASRYLRLDISDTGVGMNRATRERIFTPYFTTKDIGEGTGLGLATVHGLVEMLGGAITVHSRENRGTRFRIYLPQLETAARTDDAQTESRNGSHSHTGPRRRILFIDDERQIVEYARIALPDLGYDVDAFTSSRTALDTFLAGPERYDLVITDQTMPEHTGGEIVKAMLEIRPQLPIILCTGFSDIMDREQALNLGVSEYLIKPFRLENLREAIQRVFDTKAKTTGPAENREALSCPAS